MKEFIEKLIGRLEEESNNAEAKMYILADSEYSLPCQFDKIDIEDCKSKTFCEAISIVNQLAEEYNNDFCEWEADDKEIDVYYTKCGQAHIFIDGNPEENNHVFCPYCGKKIKVVE